MNQGESKAYNDEMSKDLDKDLIDGAQRNGQIQATNDAQKELQQSIMENRKAQFEETKAKSRNEFMNSPQMQGYTKQIIENQSEAVQLQKETDERDLMHKTQQETQKALISNGISRNTMGNNMTEVEEINYIVDNEFQPRINEQQMKENIVREIKEYSQT